MTELPCLVAHFGQGTYECRTDDLCAACKARPIVAAALAWGKARKAVDAHPFGMSIEHSDDLHELKLARYSAECAVSEIADALAAKEGE